MKFYQVFEDADQAASDCWFETRKAAETYIKEMYDDPKDATLVVHEVKGSLTKRRICQMLTDWPLR